MRRTGAFLAPSPSASEYVDVLDFGIGAAAHPGNRDRHLVRLIHVVVVAGVLCRAVLQPIPVEVPGPADDCAFGEIGEEDGQGPIAP